MPAKSVRVPLSLENQRLIKRAAQENSESVGAFLLHAGLRAAQPTRARGGGPLHKVPAGWHTTLQVARLLGCSEDRLIRLRKRKEFEPSGSMSSGQVTVRLYSDTDLARLRKLVSK